MEPGYGVQNENTSGTLCWRFEKLARRCAINVRRELKLMKRLTGAPQRGFTLIELMIVVAVISVLAAVALPQYQTYMVKSRLAEATIDLDASKIALAEAFSINGNSFPATANAPIPTSAPSNATYVSSIAYNSTNTNVASVVVGLTNTGSSNVDGQFLGIFGTGQNDGTVSWQCGTAAVATATAPGTLTTIYPYIPTACQN